MVNIIAAGWYSSLWGRALQRYIAALATLEKKVMQRPSVAETVPHYLQTKLKLILHNTCKTSTSISHEQTHCTGIFRHKKYSRQQLNKKILDLFEIYHKNMELKGRPLNKRKTLNERRYTDVKKCWAPKAACQKALKSTRYFVSIKTYTKCMPYF